MDVANGVQVQGGNTTGPPTSMAPFTSLSTVPAKRKSGDVDEEDLFPHKKRSLALQSGSNSRCSYWVVQWSVTRLSSKNTRLFVHFADLFMSNRRNPQTKKYKTWEGDGVLKMEGERYYLFGTDGKQYVTDIYCIFDAHYGAAWARANTPWVALCSQGTK